MKKNLTCLILFCIAFAACKKDSKNGSAPPTGKKLYSVNFTTGFSQQHLGFLANSLKTKTTNGLVTQAASSDTTTSLFYNVYDNAGRLVHQIAQISTDAGFGTITDQLPIGNYTIVFVGGVNTKRSADGNKFLVGTETAGNLATDSVYYDGTQDRVDLFQTPNIDETFYKKISLEVTGGTVNQDISLDRVVGLLTVTIQDAIPASSTLLSINIFGASSAFMLGSGLPGPAYSSIGTALATTSVAGVTNLTFSYYILNTITPFQVTIQCNNNDTVIAKKVISNVTCGANKQVILKGNLFGGTGTGNGLINVNADTSWKATTINYHF